jgi:hypothetical protein
LKILSELVLLLPNTDCSRSRISSDKNLQIVEGGTVFSRSRTSPDKNLQIVETNQYLIEVEQALTKIYQILTAFNNLKIFVRACSTSTKY